MNLNKLNFLKKNIMLSEWVRIALEQGIHILDIVKCLKKDFLVELIEVDGVKMIWVEKKNQRAKKEKGKTLKVEK